jgi:hypothetical protein
MTTEGVEVIEIDDNDDHIPQSVPSVHGLQNKVFLVCIWMNLDMPVVELGLVCLLYLGILLVS